VIEVEDEHAEARFVAGDRGLMGSDLSASEIAIFYRTNAQSRVLDVLVRQDVPYQVIGGPRFYERAEIRDDGVPLRAREPAGRNVAPTDRESPAPHQNTSIQKVTRAENTGRALFQAMADPGRPASRPASCRAIRSFHSTMESPSRALTKLPVDGSSKRVLEKTDARRASSRADDRRASGSRTAGARRRRREYRQQMRTPRSPASSGLARLRPGHDPATTTCLVT
jgi:DNA helicase-2/ATP-dependent DNA helicase PcrA